MKKKIIYILVSCIMVLSSLVAASCEKEEVAKEEEEEGKVVITDKTSPTEVTEEKKEEAKVSDVPQYGGTVTITTTQDIQGYDHANFSRGFLNNVYLVNDTMGAPDWSRGSAGTGEIDWASPSQKRIDFTIGALAESFEIIPPGTIIFNVRQGVHYALTDTEASKLVGGREMTAEDVAFSLDRHIHEPMSYLAFTDPTMPKNTTVTQTGPWTVQIDTGQFNLDPLWLMLPDREIWPKELIEKYGTISEWYQQVGNGPFIMTDSVVGSSATFERNPNYWMTDPVGSGKGNQLPYFDRVQMLIIPDASSSQAGFRTGRIDQLGAQSNDAAKTMIQTAPHVKYTKYLQGPNYISMRLDIPELPHTQKEVRQALMMAIDYEAIVRDWYNGEAEILAWPLAYSKGYANAYMPLEEMPQAVKDIYTYNPVKAKQMISDAGYPNGFKTMVTCTSDAVDFLSIIVDMWEDIDVELKLDIVDFGPYYNYTASRKYPEMLYGFYVQPGPYAQLLPFRIDNTFNRSWVKDATVDAAYEEILKYNLIDQAKVDQIHRELMPYVLEQAYYITVPGPYLFNFWQPWLKNYYGEVQVGYQPYWVRFSWIDQNLKRSLGY